MGSDFAPNEIPIDACFGFALAPQDLTSKMHLLALSAFSQDGATAVVVTKSLSLAQAAPLVYKSD